MKNFWLDKKKLIPGFVDEFVPRKNLLTRYGKKKFVKIMSGYGIRLIMKE